MNTYAAIEKIKILGAVLELPPKESGLPIQPIYLKIRPNWPNRQCFDYNVKAGQEKLVDINTCWLRNEFVPRLVLLPLIMERISIGASKQ